MEKIRVVKIEAEQYLCNQELHRCAPPYIPTSRFGHDTSNVAETCNKTLKLDRELPITELLGAIQEQQSSRFGEAIAAFERGENFRKDWREHLTVEYRNSSGRSLGKRHIVWWIMYTAEGEAIRCWYGYQRWYLQKAAGIATEQNGVASNGWQMVMRNRTALRQKKS
ncbi:MAG: hypothetical protein M1839_002986 [Geoglossum umbratile]|nr:MAG: hypothetical protein M1839_002986 [Geoglossum umbratile]